MEDKKVNTSCCCFSFKKKKSKPKVKEPKPKKKTLFAFMGETPSMDSISDYRTPVFGGDDQDGNQ